MGTLDAIKYTIAGIYFIYIGYIYFTLYVVDCCRETYVWSISGRFRYFETDFRMSDSIIKNMNKYFNNNNIELSAI